MIALFREIHPMPIRGCYAAASPFGGLGDRVLLRRAWGPPISVCTQPGAVSSRVRGSSTWRAAKLPMNI
jgi:hypothetical protein